MYNDEVTCDFCLNEEHFDAYQRTPALQGVKIYGVRNSGIDKRLRAEGLGQQMYLILLYELAKRGGVLVPNVAFGGSTSLAAMRAWGALASHPGVTVYAGKFFSGEGLTSKVYEKAFVCEKRERLGREDSSEVSGHQTCKCSDSGIARGRPARNVVEIRFFKQLWVMRHLFRETVISLVPRSRNDRCRLKIRPS